MWLNISSRISNDKRGGEKLQDHNFSICSKIGKHMHECTHNVKSSKIYKTTIHDVIDSVPHTTKLDHRLHPIRKTSVPMEYVTILKTVTKNHEVPILEKSPL
jgi:hypothetical protein